MNYTTIKRGDILWLKLPQTLAPVSAAPDLPFKIRPFIVLNDNLNLQTDHNRICQQDRTIFGMDCTSKKYLVEGRPHVSFQMPNSKEPETFAMFDSLRDVSSYEQKLRISHHLPGEAETALSGYLDSVLRPEQKFFLSKLFNSRAAYMPGDIWRIKTINADGEALILLRRGQFVSSEHVEHSDHVDRGRQDVRKSPYLVAFFKKATDVKSLRRMTWNDLQIMSVQENCFQYKTAALSQETGGILLNNIRARAGLAPIEYKQPIFKNMLGLGPILRMIAAPLGMRQP